jgi:hypothetical protein
MKRTLGSVALVVGVGLTAAGCSADPPTISAPSAGDPATGLDGVYRYDLTEEYLIAAGISESLAKQNSGITTVTIYDGVYTEQWSNAALGNKTCLGTSETEGARLSVRWTPGAGCQGAWSMTATTAGDQLTWSDIEPARAGEVNDYAVYYATPWTRIGDAAAGTGS